MWVRDLSFGGGTAFQKKGVGTAASPLVTAPPSNLTRLYYNPGLQRLRRQISLDYYTITPATQAMLSPSIARLLI